MRSPLESRALQCVCTLIFVLAAASVSRAQPPLDIDSFVVPGDGANVWRLTPGPDGAVWFTLTRCDDPNCTTTIRHDAIGRITADGTRTEFALPFTTEPHGAGPYGIAAGPDGALWFAEIRGDAIGRMTTTGSLSLYPLPPSPIPPADNAPYDITSGPDGALWFTQMFAIGRITTAGAITRFLVGPTDPTSIVTGPDGALWFTELNGNRIGRMTTAGALTAYPLAWTCNPHGITAGPDGALWFACFAGTIGRITVDGAVSTYGVPSPDSGPIYIASGPDGALWFTEQKTGLLGRITVDGAVTEYPSPPGDGFLIPITRAPDGLWFAKGRTIDHLRLLDSVPPVISGMPGPACDIWPPNHKLTTVATITATDTESGISPGSLAVTVVSSEPQAPGLPDFLVSPNGSGGLVVQLRAERRGGSTRVYTVTATVSDLAGNTTRVTSTCTVPANRGG